MINKRYCMQAESQYELNRLFWYFCQHTPDPHMDAAELKEMITFMDEDDSSFNHCYGMLNGKGRNFNKKETKLNQGADYEFDEFQSILMRRTYG